MVVVTTHNQQRRRCSGLGSITLIKLLACLGIVGVIQQVLLTTEETRNSNDSSKSTSHAATNPLYKSIDTTSQKVLPQSSLKRCSVPWKQAGPLARSQRKQDYNLLLSTYFPNACYGTYLEIGALNGDEELSNTYILNKGGINWTGVLIEGNPYVFDDLKRNRPNEMAIVPNAICSESTTVHYLGGNQSLVAGIWEFMSEEEKQRDWKGYKLQDTIEVSCKPLSSVLRETVGLPAHFHFDFYSLNVERAALQQVLESVSVNKVSFGVIYIEADEAYNNEENNKRIVQLLEKQGYRQHHHSSSAMWYVHRQFDDIYAHLGQKPLFDDTWA